MNKYYTIFRLLLIRNGFKKAEYLKKKKIFHSIGNNCYYHPWNIPRESYLVEFGDNVIVAANVSFVTHDIAGVMLKNRESSADCGRIFMGTIKVGDNVFIGANSIILPNVKIGSNCIIAAGSVVVKDIPDNSVAGGNPACVIKDMDSFVEKRRKDIIRMPSWRDSIKNIEEYFWS